MEEVQLAEGLLRDGGADAVGTDQQVGLPVAAVLEVGGDRIGRLGITRERLAGVDQVGRHHREHALHRRRAQHAVVPAGQAGAGLGARVERQPRAQPAAVVAELGDAVGAERVDVHAHVAQHRQHRQRQQHRAAQRLDSLLSLEQAHLVAGTVEGQRGRKSAGAGADDGHAAARR